MGYDYSLSTGSYFNFIPASYGILNAIHGTSADLAAIDLDCMVLDGYNTAAYYNNLNNINNDLSAKFATISKLAAGGFNGTSGASGASGSTSSSGNKTGDDDERGEYNKKVQFIEDFLAFRNNKEIKKALSEIKKGDMTYEEAIEKLDELLASLDEADLEAFANKRAKARCKSSQDGSGYGIATEAKAQLMQWDNENMDSAKMQLMQTLVNGLNNENILDFIDGYGNGGGINIIQTIQEKTKLGARERRILSRPYVKFDGVRVIKRNGNIKKYNLEKYNQFNNYVTDILATVCNALVKKAEQNSDYLSEEAKQHLANLRTQMSGSDLANNSSLASAFSAVYNDIRYIDADIVNKDVKEEFESIVPGRSISVTGAKSINNRPAQRTPVDPVHAEPGSM